MAEPYRGRVTEGQIWILHEDMVDLERYSAEVSAGRAVEVVKTFDYGRNAAPLAEPVLVLNLDAATGRHSEPVLERCYVLARRALERQNLIWDPFIDGEWG